MKKAFFVLYIVFVVLTLVGAGFVLFSHGKMNAGYACVPMVFSIIFNSLYRKCK